MRTLFFLAVAFAMLACSTTNRHEALENGLKEIMEKNNAAGLMVAAVKDGKVVYSSAFGYKDIDKQIPIGEDDVLRIASISKSFTATAILQLAGEGKLDLDTDISELMGFELRNPNFPEIPVTVRMLLSHTSSMSDANGYFSFDYINPAVSPTWQKAWNTYEPGSSYQYCNLGYNTLGAIIEKVSGERFDDYIENHIFKPLGVYASHNVMDLDSTRFIKIYTFNQADSTFKCSTTAYSAPTEELENYRMGYSTTVFSPTGGVKISAKDLARVMIMHMNYGQVDGIRILDSASCALMRSDITTTNYPGETYGMALLNSDDFLQGCRVTGHDGLALGAYTSMFWLPEENFGTIVMTNGCNGKTDKTFANIMRESAELLKAHFCN